uniref:Uncharacterized protein n=1 Tax=Lactuca sativa TaxID=4236 RepID=A0A9R1VW36_LACSA|nr:hypothetical protein LSAT_V11C300124870 [Lactuca sativa]
MADRSYGSSSSSSSTLNYENVLCRCGEEPKIWTSTTRKNPRRHCIRCPNSLDLGLHWYKSKMNELHRENMILSKKNMELEKENMNL